MKDTLDSFYQEAQETLAHADEAMKGVVKSVEIMTTEEAYGTSEVTNPDAKVIVVTVDAGDAQVREIFGAPKGPRSWKNPKFKLAAYKQKYKDFPREGQKVALEVNDDGFLRISL